MDKSIEFIRRIKERGYTNSFVAGKLFQGGDHPFRKEILPYIDTTAFKVYMHDYWC